MTRKFAAEGGIVNYIAAGDITSGQVVVMANTLGVALKSGASGDTIPVAIEGVFELPKVSGAVFAVGEKLIFIAATSDFDDSSAVVAEGDITGAAIALRAGANLETTCLAKLCPGNAAVEPPEE